MKVHKRGWQPIHLTRNVNRTRTQPRNKKRNNVHFVSPGFKLHKHHLVKRFRSFMNLEVLHLTLLLLNVGCCCDFIFSSSIFCSLFWNWIQPAIILLQSILTQSLCDIRSLESIRGMMVLSITESTFSSAFLLNVKIYFDLGLKGKTPQWAKGRKISCSSDEE